VATGLAGPNALARDAQGRLYVSESGSGSIRRIDNPTAASPTLTPWVQNAVLTPPPGGFGANGLAFDAAKQNLYVAVTSSDSVYRIPVNTDGTAGTPALVASGATLGQTGALDGADGIAFDTAGNLYVCANAAGGTGEVQVLSGVAPGGTPALTTRFQPQGGTAFASAASISFRGNQAYIANLAIGSANGKLSVLTTPQPGLPVP
jgi:sugar lactone lactonase YvrE